MIIEKDKKKLKSCVFLSVSSMTIHTKLSLVSCLVVAFTIVILSIKGIILLDTFIGYKFLIGNGK